MQIDALTGVGSYRELKSLRRGSAVALIDLVEFIRVNYDHGHLVGDAVLKAIGSRLQTGLPHYRVFRAGGDEFALEISGGLERTAALALGNRIRDLIVTEPIGERRISVDARVVVCLRRVGDDPWQIIDQARQAAAVAAHDGVAVVVSE